MNRQELCRQRVNLWLEGLQTDSLPLDSPRLRIEELSLGSLKNFFVLLLASSPEPPQTPIEALERAGGLEQMELYRQKLALPLHGSPYELNTAIRLGPPSGELFALQERLLDEIDEEGRAILLRLGQLF